MLLFIVVVIFCYAGKGPASLRKEQGNSRLKGQQREMLRGHRAGGLPHSGAQTQGGLDSEPKYPAAAHFSATYPLVSKLRPGPFTAVRKGIQAL